MNGKFLDLCTLHARETIPQDKPTSHKGLGTVLRGRLSTPFAGWFLGCFSPFVDAPQFRVLTLPLSFCRSASSLAPGVSSRPFRVSHCCCFGHRNPPIQLKDSSGVRWHISPRPFVCFFFFFGFFFFFFVWVFFFFLSVYFFFGVACLMSWHPLRLSLVRPRPVFFPV